MSPIPYIDVSHLTLLNPAFLGHLPPKKSQGEHASRLQIRNSVGDPLAKSLALEIDSREADLSAPGTLDGRGGDLLVAPRSVEVGERWKPGLYGPSDLPFRSRIIHGRVIKEVMPEALLPPPKEQQQQQHEPFLEDDAKTANDATVEELVSLSVDPVLAEEALGATKGGGIVEAIRSDSTAWFGFGF